MIVFQCTKRNLSQLLSATASGTEIIYHYPMQRIHSSGKTASMCATVLYPPFNRMNIPLYRHGTNGCRIAFNVKALRLASVYTGCKHQRIGREEIERRNLAAIKTSGIMRCSLQRDPSIMMRYKIMIRYVLQSAVKTDGIGSGMTVPTRELMMNRSTEPCYRRCDRHVTHSASSKLSLKHGTQIAGKDITFYKRIAKVSDTHWATQ